MKRDNASTTKAKTKSAPLSPKPTTLPRDAEDQYLLDSEPVLHYGAPRELESQVSFALSSVRVVAGFLGASRYGTCNDDQETEAAGEVLDRASEFLEGLDLSRVTIKPPTPEEE